MIAIVDLYSRKNIAYSVVNTMDTLHCVETLQLAVSRYSVPKIFNSDQGSQFTSREFTDELKKLGIAKKKMTVRCARMRKMLLILRSIVVHQRPFDKDFQKKVSKSLDF